MVCCGNKGHMTAECGKRREDITCNSCGQQMHASRVCLTSYEERNLSSPKKGDKTTVLSVKVTKEAAKEPWLTEDKDKEDGDHVHLVRPAAGGNRSTRVLRAMIRQGPIRGVEVKCTPDTGATRTVLAADMVRRLGLVGEHLSAEKPLPFILPKSVGKRETLFTLCFAKNICPRWDQELPPKRKKCEFFVTYITITFGEGGNTHIHIVWSNFNFFTDFYKIFGSSSYLEGSLKTVACPCVNYFLFIC